MFYRHAGKMRRPRGNFQLIIIIRSFGYIKAALAIIKDYSDGTIIIYLTVKVYAVDIEI